MSGQDPKADLLKWANSQVHLAPAAKAVLKELASFADADGCAWAKIDTLAYGTNLKERQVQRHLEALREEGLIKASGRTHRLKKSTRSVPLYQLAPAIFEALDDAAPSPAMGGVDDTHTEACMGGVDDTHGDVHGCHGRQAMGGVDDTPHRRPLGDQSGAKAPSPGARDLAVWFGQLEAATPRRVFKHTDRDAAFEAFAALAGQGVDVTALAGCARRMAVDPVWLSKRVPSSLQDWIGKGQWRGWEAEAPAAAGGLEAAVVFDGPPTVRAAVVAAQGEDFARTTIDFCRFAPGSPGRLMPRTGWIEQQLRAVKRELGALDVIVQGRA